MNNINNPIIADDLHQSFVEEVKNDPIPIKNNGIKLEISKTIHFYKGTSFRWVGDWMVGKTYTNDEFNIDVVYHKGTSWVCVMSHISNINTEPSEDSQYWNIHVYQSGPGIHVGETPPTEEKFGEEFSNMLWLDTSLESKTTSVYSKDQADEKLSHKAGVFHPTDDGQHYLVFADLESRDLYLQNPERKDLLIATINTNFISEDLLVDFVSKEVSKIVADAPEDLNILKEISDFIKSDSANAATIIKDMDSLNKRVDTIENNSYIILSESEYEQLENKEDRLYFLYDVEEDGNI